MFIKFPSVDVVKFNGCIGEIYIFVYCSINFSIGCLARLEVNDLLASSFEKQSFTIYPNPFSESITIESKNINLSNATVELYDINGRKLYEHERINTINTLITINEDLPKGNYFIKISSDGITQTVKIIKQ